MGQIEQAGRAIGTVTEAHVEDGAIVAKIKLADGVDPALLDQIRGFRIRGIADVDDRTGVVSDFEPRTLTVKVGPGVGEVWAPGVAERAAETIVGTPFVDRPGGLR